MEELIAIPVGEYERLKASEKGLDELRKIQLDNIQREIDDIRLRQHEKMMESITRVQTLCALAPYFWEI
jgi:hypothetical protein